MHKVQVVCAQCLTCGRAHCSRCQARSTPATPLDPPAALNPCGGLPACGGWHRTCTAQGGTGGCQGSGVALGMAAEASQCPAQQTAQSLGCIICRAGELVPSRLSAPRMAAGASRCPVQQTAQSLCGTICRTGELVPNRKPNPVAAPSAEQKSCCHNLDGRSAEACWFPAQWVSWSKSQPWPKGLSVPCCTAEPVSALHTR